MRTKIASLESVLKYNGENIVYVFLNNFSIPNEDAESLFLEIKRWLWFCATVRERKNNGTIRADYNPSMDSILMAMMDEMWHTFILSTPDYLDFCNKYFGYFLHHNFPKKPSTKNILKNKTTVLNEELMNKIKEKSQYHYSLVYDILGADTLSYWYQTLPMKYPQDKINSFRS